MDGEGRALRAPVHFGERLVQLGPPRGQVPENLLVELPYDAKAVARGDREIDQIGREDSSRRAVDLC